VFSLLLSLELELGLALAALFSVGVSLTVGTDAEASDYGPQNAEVDTFQDGRLSNPC
jgi:hypothetical protein